MGHRSKSAVRCERCRMHEERCLCAHLPTMDLKTRLCLVMHCRETQKTTATGPMALAALSNHELHIQGLPQTRLDLSHLFEPERRVFLLYPAEDARPLESSWVKADERPVTLVVPDGNWRQASRVARRMPGLEGATRVTLPPGPPTRWGIRRETKDGGLATFEAIARAFGVLESPDVQHTLEAFFDKMVAATWETRGAIQPALDDGAPDERQSEERT